MDIYRLAVTEDLKKRLALFSSELEGLKTVTKLLGDASSRVFLRLHFESGNTAIAMCYPAESISETNLFVEMQKYLSSLNLPTPSILFEFHQLGILVMDDLGDNLLEHSLQTLDAKSGFELYEKAVDLIVQMIVADDSSSLKCGAHDLAFDFEKLSFEMNFFIKHFVFGFLGRNLDSQTENKLRESLNSLCVTLAGEPRFLAHRDYHARNLMVHNGKLFMIDFQDARMGPIQYDLASLLRDSYVTLHPASLQSLTERFFEATKSLSGVPRDRFGFMFDMTALQRNIKALGTFGYQTTVRQTDRYRSSIDRTISYIEENLSRNPNIIGHPEIILGLLRDGAKEID